MAAIESTWLPEALEMNQERMLCISCTHTALYAASRHGRDPIIRRMRTPPPGFHSSSVHHARLSSWAPLTDNRRRQPVQLQAKLSTFYRPKHVSGKMTESIQCGCAFNTLSQYLDCSSLLLTAVILQPLCRVSQKTQSMSD
ncbi:ABC transporter G family member 49 [Clarias magur]|uniref:ABC transporter G family member 49 n=1 Tax=Clarias magur TaxID=1594786 RepID=A0A8J4TVL9_CLAMG|nr:ABC transporter G family member 49 [Clarias magur]